MRHQNGVAAEVFQRSVDLDDFLDDSSEEDHIDVLLSRAAHVELDESVLHHLLLDLLAFGNFSVLETAFRASIGVQYFI